MLTNSLESIVISPIGLINEQSVVHVAVLGEEASKMDADELLERAKNIVYVEVHSYEWCFLLTRLPRLNSTSWEITITNVLQMELEAEFQIGLVKLTTSTADMLAELFQYLHRLGCPLYNATLVNGVE
jgi:hypothetical protein